jgi:hypothetical protein
LKSSAFFRIASVLLLLFAAGHTLGFRQNNPEWGADAVLGLKRFVHFDAQGFTRTYWGTRNCTRQCVAPCNTHKTLGSGLFSIMSLRATISSHLRTLSLRAVAARRI